MVAMLDDAVVATRRIATDLRPLILDDLGVSEKELRLMSTDAVTEIAESLGASETLETVR